MSVEADSRRLRVLELTGVSVGGSAEHVLLLAPLLDRDRLDVRLALWSGGPLDEALVATGLPTTFLDRRHRSVASTRKATAFSGNPLRFVSGFFRLIMLLRRERIQVLHTHTSVAGALGRAAAVIARVPIRVHMLHSIASNDHVSPRARRVFRVMERWTDRATTHYIAGSDAIARKTVELGICESSKVTRVHYSMDVERFNIDLERGGESRRALLHPRSDMVVIGFVGRLEDQKGVDVLIDAMPLVVTECPEARLVIVGDGSLRRQLEAQVARLDIRDYVLFTGWTDGAGAVMSSFDIMALPSRWEAFGIVNLEAMAASIPVVASNVEGIPEVVADGTTGVLVGPEDAQSLARALIGLVSDPAERRRLGDAGHQRLIDRFLPQRMVDEHEALFDRLAGEIDHRLGT